MAPELDQLHKCPSIHSTQLVQWNWADVPHQPTVKLLMKMETVTQLSKDMYPPHLVPPPLMLSQLKGKVKGHPHLLCPTTKLAGVPAEMTTCIIFMITMDKCV